jgi:tetratricopeptide (TPR) repeat protein
MVRVRTLARALLCLPLLLPPWTAAGAAAAQDAADARYREVIEDAVLRSRAGQLQEALALFLEAHRLRPSARTLRGIGLVRFSLADYAGAIDALEDSLADTRRPLDEEARAEVEGVLEEARRFVARLTLRVTPEGATVTVDGAPRSVADAPLLLNPGRHEVVVQGRDGHVEQRTVVVEGGAARTLRIALPVRPTPPEPPREIALQVRADREGLTLHASPLDGDGEVVEHAVSEVCDAPCEASLPAGLYRLGLRAGDGDVRRMGDYRLEEAVAIELSHEDRSGLRAAGWVFGSVGVVSGLLLFLLTAEVDSSADGFLTAIGVGVTAAGLGAGLPLIFLADRDTLAIRALP